jgi:lipoprotein-anchoring transpeptidase ErfK/SrfK
VSQHRAGSEHRRAAVPQSRHRAEVRPRYGRIVTLTASLAVIVVAVMGATGLLPTEAGDADPAAAIDDGSGDRPDTSARDQLAQQLADTDSGAPSADTELTTDADDTTLPLGSGEGRRVVFSESRQRVWLVDDGAQVVRTYEVSGSLTDNLDTGTFHVYSRSEDAVGVDDSGTMRWFVRFTQGDEGAAIGFHDIPIDDGQPVQTIAQLGTPQSHGCIRQREQDALAMWEFAPIGTTVVVTA